MILMNGMYLSPQLAVGCRKLDVGLNIYFSTKIIAEPKK